VIKYDISKELDIITIKKAKPIKNFSVLNIKGCKEMV